MLRPYGICGRPCLGAKAVPKPKNYDSFLEAVAKVARNFIQIISVRMGRLAINDENINDPYDQAQAKSVIKKTF